MAELHSLSAAGIRLVLLLFDWRNESIRSYRRFASIHSGKKNIRRRLQWLHICNFPANIANVFFLLLLSCPPPKKPQVVVFQPYYQFTTLTPTVVDLSEYLYELYHFF